MVYSSFSLYYNLFTGLKSQPQPSQTGNLICPVLYRSFFFWKINMIKRLICVTDIYSSFSLYCNSLTGQKSQPQPSQTGNFMSYYLQIPFFPCKIIRQVKRFVCFTAFLLFLFIVIHSQDRNPNPSLLSLVISCPVLNRFCFFCKISMIKRYACCTDIFFFFSLHLFIHRTEIPAPAFLVW